VESIETVTITNPANPVLIWWVVAQPLLLLLSYLVGRATRFLLRGRVAVSDAAATLIALIGLWLGWHAPWMLAYGFVMGALIAGVVALALLATRRVSRQDSIAYGPYLIVGAFLAWPAAIA